MSTTSSGPAALSSDELASIVARHAHDLRNALNGMELELTLLLESSADATVRTAVQRLLEALGQTDRMVRLFSAKLLRESRSVVCATDMAEQWKLDASALLGAQNIAWDIGLHGALVFIEAATIRSVLVDLLAIAMRHHLLGPLRVTWQNRNERAVLEITPDGPASPASACDERQQLFWSALQRLVARDDGRLEPDTLGHPWWHR